MATLEKSTVKSLSVPSGFSREDYSIERQWAIAPDGEKVGARIRASVSALIDLIFNHIAAEEWFYFSSFFLKMMIECIYICRFQYL